MTKWALAAPAMLALVACSDSNDKDPADGSVTQKDVGVTDTSSACGPGVYPCGPYGTTVGSVAANLSWKGFADPQNHCKAHKDKKMDTTKLVDIGFADWFLGKKGCETYKKELLWVVVSAGWCQPCQAEVKAIQTKYAGGKYDKRLGLVNVVFESGPPTIKPADETFIKTWITTFGLTLPVAMDTSFKMGAYFSKKNAPFNMFIDLKTMKIYYRNEGSATTDYDSIVKKFFGN